ncbi:MAG TPA: response regulator transcription factor [Candidatus Saccharimonadales bacterium]|jgi:two-component system invasion response regulator UvrY|nr:response regulator transcription factor [Candidatus Saccharimonadales bacterium]
MIQAVIASNSAVVREGLKAILGQAAQIVVHVQDEILESGSSGPADILIVDLALAGQGNEFEFVQQVRREFPVVPVLALGARFDLNAGMYAMQAGAAGYLSQYSPPGELIAAVERVAAGGRFVPAALAQSLIRRLERSGRPVHELLSRREWQVFLGLASGRSPSQIAAALALSVKTISTYRSRILEKMALTTTAELMHYAIQNRISEAAVADQTSVEYPTSVTGFQVNAAV